MPSHQARRKPLPKDYQFPTVAQVEARRYDAGTLARLRALWPLMSAEGRARAVANGEVFPLDDDGEGYGHAV
jgi:hypothetical protein